MLQTAEKAQSFQHILIADDHPMFRDVLADTMRRAYPNANIYSADSFADAMSIAMKHPEIDLFILDLLFPGMNAEVSISQIRKDFPHASIVIITMWEDRTIANRMIDAGADGFLGKGLSAQEMLSNLEHIRAGDFVVNIASNEKNSSNLMLQESIILTPRQIDILKLLQKQMQNKSIARVLGLSPHTVRNHVVVLMRILGVSKRKLIVGRALEKGLIEPIDDAPEN